MRTSTLAYGMAKDINSRVHPASKDSMVKDTRCTDMVVNTKATQGKKKKLTKRPYTTKVPSVNEE